MGTQRGGSFDRRLEDALVTRLQAGQPPEDLLEELRTRLDDAAAQALLASAQARARPPAAPTSPILRILAGLPYVWMVLLVVQQLYVAIAVVQSRQGMSALGGYTAMLDAIMIGLALLRVFLLCAGAFAYKRWRSAGTTAFFAATVLYAFPLGVVIDQFVMPYPVRPDPAIIMSMSAVCSYAAVFLIALNYLQGRQAVSAAEPA